MKQIKITLNRTPPAYVDWHGSTPFGHVGFCNGVITTIQPKAKESSSLTMTLSSKRLPGFVAVNLRRPESSFWRWEIPALNLVDLTNHNPMHIFSFGDDTTNRAIRRLMGKGDTYPVPSKRTVWVKLTPGA